MCGIVGRVVLDGQVCRESLRSQVAVLRHRGPDASGVWLSPDERVGFGHCRLSVIDLSPAARQPMVTSDQSLALTFNGEIYNYRQLRDRLAQRGHTFKSDGDTEVLLAAYRQWGDDCVLHLVGMFAFAIYDGERGKLLLARDRVGEKPLYYVQSVNGIQFASELKALIADRKLPRVLDSAALNEFLAYGYVASERCMLAGYRKVMPGTRMTFDLRTGRVSSSQYWSTPEPRDVMDALPLGAASMANLVERLESLLLASVEGQLLADVPLGVMLSGGVDSSLITALAARVSGGPLNTFTVSFPGHDSFDEAPFARLVARHCGTRHHELSAPEADADLLPLLARQFDEPIGDSSMIPTYLVARAIREHATVALGGDGGDELFGGYPHYRWLLQERLFRDSAPSWVTSGIAVLANALPLGTRGRHRLIGLRGDWAHRLGRINLLFDADERRALSPYLRDMGSESDAVPEDSRWPIGLDSGAPPVHAAALADFLGYLPSDLLVKVDRSSMLASLEVRAPFLDHRVVEFAFRDVPVEWKVTRRRSKIVLKELARRWLPPELPLERKQGFSVPLAAWFRGAWREPLLDGLRNAPGTLLARDNVERLVQSLDKGRRNEHRLFALLMLELWRDQYGVSVA